MKKISIITDFKNNDFEVIENPFEANKKWKGLVGIRDKMSYSELDERIRSGGKSYLLSYHNVPNYYGTVWVAYKWLMENKALRLVVKGRYKDIKRMKDQGFKIKKVVLEEYKNGKE